MALVRAHGTVSITCLDRATIRQLTSISDAALVCCSASKRARVPRASASAAPPMRTRLRKALLQRALQQLTQRALDDAADLTARILMT
jgi:hypothetical protein